MKRNKLEGKAAIGMIIGGDVLLLLMGWFFLIGPQRSTAASIANATAVAEVQLADAKKPVVVVKPAAVTQPVIRTADLYSLAKAMPSTEDMPDLLLQLDQVARSAGVTLTSISPGPPTPSADGSYSSVAINLAFSGDFYSLTDMLYRLRSLVTVHGGSLQTAGRLFSIGSVALTPTGAGAQLNATVTVNAYVYGMTPAAAAAAAAAAPVPAAPAAPAATTTPATTNTTSAPTTTSSDNVAPRP
jgi:Tfp pilus assembly protein PilO